MTVRDYLEIVFLPWLTLNEPASVAGVDFVPWRDSHGSVSPVLRDADEHLKVILAGYVGRDGRPVTNCTLATMPGRGWNLDEADFGTVQWSVALLFLATWSRNEYFPRFGGPYVNSSSFRPVWQRFSVPPAWIALTSRRRDGRTTDGGYRHGEVTFHVPPQCSVREPAQPEAAFLAALDSGHRAGSVTLARLRPAITFVQLANTDDDAMALEPEAILMGSAFEQLLGGDASSYTLGKKVAPLLGHCGEVTVEDALRDRPQIEVDVSTPERAAAQPKWWVHRKWVEELYDLRSTSVHEGRGHERTWAWMPGEHLVMSAFVFPLIVKSLLQREGHYTLTETDRDRCHSIDHLLATTEWAEDDGTGSRWQTVVREKARKRRFETAVGHYLAEHSETTEDDTPA